MCEVRAINRNRIDVTNRIRAMHRIYNNLRDLRRRRIGRNNRRYRVAINLYTVNLNRSRERCVVFTRQDDINTGRRRQ